MTDYHTYPSIWTPDLLTVSVLKFECPYKYHNDMSAGWVPNSVDPDQMHFAASDLGLHCLHRPVCPNKYLGKIWWILALGQLQILCFTVLSYLQLFYVVFYFVSFLTNKGQGHTKGIRNTADISGKNLNHQSGGGPHLHTTKDQDRKEIDING